jgi:hypothetical protein
MCPKSGLGFRQRSCTNKRISDGSDPTQPDRLLDWPDGSFGAFHRFIETVKAPDFDLTRYLSREPAPASLDKVRHLVQMPVPVESIKLQEKRRSRRVSGILPERLPKASSLSALPRSLAPKPCSEPFAALGLALKKPCPGVLFRTGRISAEAKVAILSAWRLPLY